MLTESKNTINGPGSIFPAYLDLKHFINIIQTICYDYMLTE